MIKKLFGKLHYNSPVILTYALLSLLALLLNIITGGWSNREIFTVYRTSFLDPMQYVRLITHVIGHSGYDHFLKNFTIILLVGPMLEEKYGSKQLLKMILFTAALTGLIQVIFFHPTGLLGASGIAFMLMLLTSFANIEKGKIPLTVILVAVIYLSGEVADGLLKKDNISQMGHIIGGLCGCLFGWAITKPKKAESQ